VGEQRSIITTYKKDIAKYDPEDKLYLEDIFDLIPSELNAKNKRFIMKNLNENFKLSRYRNSFIWLRDAGVALSAFCANEPTSPLLLSKSTNLFKLFLADVGLLAAMYMDNIQIKILNKEKDINFGAVYENAAAQELVAHGFDLYYFNSKKQGEIDFLIEQNGEVLPIEIKSGKDYTKHAALNHVLENENYKIERALVFHNGNVSKKEKVTYYPIYMLMFLQKNVEQLELIYKIDLSVLK
jgi:predicted AAA+ superfamily ATPase